MDLGLSFTGYLRLLTPGGVLAIVAVLAMGPFSFQSIWRVRAYGNDQGEVVSKLRHQPGKCRPSGAHERCRPAGLPYALWVRSGKAQNEQMLPALRPRDGVIGLPAYG